MLIQPYTPSLKNEWDNFVSSAANATFLHLRDYMDYHSHRFNDCSLIIRNDKGKIAALLPACFDNKTVYSHKGLTYGGLIVPRRHFPIPDTVEVFTLLVNHFRAMGMKEFVYKPVPHIFTDYPSEADIYALHQMGATVENCRLSSAIPLEQPLLFNETARQLAAKNRLIYSTHSSPAEFWNLLTDILASRHDAKPVHSLAEIELLMSRFPDNIRLVEARNEQGTLLCGSVLFISNKTVHFQYIAVNEEGRETGAFQWLVKEIIANECHGKQFLDFGTSNIPGTNRLNDGLINQKYGLGGRPVAFLTFSLAI